MTDETTALSIFYLNSYFNKLIDILNYKMLDNLNENRINFARTLFMENVVFTKYKLIFQWTIYLMSPCHVPTLDIF